MPAVEQNEVVALSCPVVLYTALHCSPASGGNPYELLTMLGNLKHVQCM